MYLLSTAHTHTCPPHPPHPPAGLCLPSAAAPACVVLGLISRVRGVFPSLPHAAHHHHVTSKGGGGRRKRIRVRDDDGAALHCIRSTSCHPFPGLKEIKSAATQCEQLSPCLHVNRHAADSSRAATSKAKKAARRWMHYLFTCRNGGMADRTGEAGRHRTADPDLPCGKQRPETSLPTGLTQAPDFPSLQERECVYPGTRSSQTNRPCCADRRLLLLLLSV